ncbi:ras-related protein Rab-13-like [Sycon ciliatum]|uniref:ras-related protein Rab-13-like n=1 Tax=Sycon ciliatum TaxID=27933 RepID=UPI0020A89125|eukprot:scpid59396/ scgid13062/ Ras-related protein Rab-13; Cell growth-inhibiting gene 4 protein
MADSDAGPMLRRYDTLVKMMFLGDSGVGKTCLMSSYAGQPVSDSHISTIGIDFKMHTVDIDGHIARIQMWDTAGQERFHTLCTQYYRRAEGVMLVFDITNEESFRNVRMWLQSVEDHAPQDVCQVLIGNKSDLDGNRRVRKTDASALAEEFGITYFETSAKLTTNNNMSEAMELLIRQILEKKGVFNDEANKDEHTASIRLDENPASTQSTQSSYCSC